MSLPREKKHAQRIVNKNSLEPPIDIVGILKHYADYEEDSLPGDIDAICIMTKKPLVIVDKFQAPNRKRFTLAHELGHIILPWHHGMISCHTGTEDVIDGSDYDRMEAEANSFAAELLMPSNWLKEFIAKHEKSGVEYLVDQVSTKAQVSRLAAFYSIINQLPSGYYIYIYNNQTDFAYSKKSPGTDLYIPHHLDPYERIEWWDDIAFDSSKFKIDSLEIYYWKVVNYLPVEKLSEEVNKVNQIGLGNVIKNMLDHGKGTFFSVFLQLIKLLPPGYILMIVQGEYQGYFSSPGTKVYPPHRLDKVQLEDWFKEFSTEWGVFPVSSYFCYWAKFSTPTSSPSNSIDNRHSKEILKDILKECYPDEEERKRYLYRVNGVVGALNNEAPDEFNEYYRMFQERFIGTTFEDIAIHPLFESFVINKINEMMTRKNAKRKQY